MKFPASLFFATVCALAQSPGLTQCVLSVEDAMGTGDLASASELIDSGLKQYPNAGGLLNLRGIVHARQGQLVEARDDFAEAVRHEPRLTPAWQNLARACGSLEPKDASALRCAIDSWRRVLRLKSGDEEAQTALARLLAASTQYANSLDAIQGMPEALCSRPENLLVRCIDLCYLGRSDEALSAATQLGALAGLSEAALDLVDPLLQSPKAALVTAALIEGLDARAPVGLGSLQKLAVAYEQLQRIPDAQKTLERIAALDPVNPAHLLELARLAELGKHYEEALGYLAHARDLAPQNAQIHFLFGVIAEEMELPLEARASLERAIALSPENPSYNYAMGSVLLNTRDALSAAKYFEKFVRARPSDPRGYYALGISYFASGDYDRAKQEMKEVEHDPKAKAGANYFLGRIARADGELDEAGRRLRESIALLPNFSEAHTELARVLLDQDKFDEAEIELGKALQLDPKSFQGNNQLLVLYRRRHDSRGDKQAEILRQLDEARSQRAELMLRTIEARP